MNTVAVAASKPYSVKIGAGLLSSLGEEAKNMNGIQNVCIVSDSAVYPLYGKAVLESLCSAGFHVTPYVFPSGEASKNGETYLSLLNFLAENHLARTDMIVALGGGVVGDLAGFAAATYLRGIRLIQLPTTLLSAVDSSVGGKTAIDLPGGKNLAGAFYQPNLVLCDTDTLSTLPQEVFQDGCAEVIKYAILYDPYLFHLLEKNLLSFDREQVITRCVSLKKEAVMKDEFDTGARMLLNLGHTIGHGIEKCSNYSISHGRAVASGIGIVSRAAASLGYCSQKDCDRILSLLASFGLPISTNFSAEQLFDAALSDKKRSGDVVNLIVPRALGRCSRISTPVDELLCFIKAGL